MRLTLPRVELWVLDVVLVLIIVSLLYLKFEGEIEVILLVLVVYAVVARQLPKATIKELETKLNKSLSKVASLEKDNINLSNEIKALKAVNKDSLKTIEEGLSKIVKSVKITN